MKTIFKSLLFLSFVLCISCNDSDDITINASNKLIGYWVSPVADGNQLKFKRASSLKKDAYGMAFLAKSECIERTSGWCGTPPISYFDQLGSWSQQDNIITIFLDNGIDEFTQIKWEIESVDNEYLIVTTMVQ